MPRQRRTWRIALIAFVLGLAVPAGTVASSAASAPSLTAEAPQSQAGAGLRVMTWNIQHAAPNGGPDIADPERIAAVIRAENPDIVTLNEVHDDEDGPSSHGHQPAELAALLVEDGYRYTYYAASVVNGPAHPGTRGEMVLSKHPIYTDPHDPRAPEHIALPTDNAHPGGKARRGLLAVTVKVPGIGDVRLYVTHLSTPSSALHVEDQKQQVRMILDEIGSVDDPVVLAGDLNIRWTDAPSGPTANNLLHSWIADAGLVDSWTRLNDSRDGVTRPNSYGRPDGDHPDRRIDYVFVSPALVAQGGHVSLVDRDASDHLAVVIDLTVRRPHVTASASALAGPEGVSGWGDIVVTQNHRVTLAACKTVGSTADDGTTVRATLSHPSSAVPIHVVADGGTSRDRCTTETFRDRLPTDTVLKVCLMHGDHELHCREEHLAT